MNTEKKGPIGFSDNIGYPYAGVESKKQLVERIYLSLNQEKQLEVDFGLFKDNLETKKQALDFFVSRCFDFQEALTTAENQISDLLTDDPFIPEEMTFELVHKPKTIHDSPIRVYSALYDENFTMYREIIDVNDADADPSRWIIMKKTEDSSEFKKIPVRITSRRVGFVILSAIGVNMEPPQSEGSIPEPEN